MPPATTKIDTCGIVSLDPSNPIQQEIRPLISDILRTKYCVQGSVFLVEAIDYISVNKGSKTVRLLLGDGELAIQGFVRGSMHWVVEGEKVFEGGYVRLNRFELAEVAGREGGGRERLLVVGDLRTVGWNAKYLEVLRGEGREVKDVRELMGGDKKGEGKLFGLEARANEMEVGRERIQQEEKRPREENEREKREEVVVEEKEEEAGHDGKDQDYISESDDEDDGFERMEISNERATQRRIMAAANTNTTSNNNTTPQRPPPPSKQQQHPRHPKVLPPPPSRPILTPKNPRPQQLSKVQNSTIPKPLPWLSNDPTQPLKLTPLSQIPHLPYKQNWMVNVLVIVTQLGEVEPCPYPPYVQRQARVIDQSAPDRHIHLTVFLEPETFEPRLGEVFLLMGVKNHKFDGGSLKKYVSDRPKGGGRWWVEGGKLEWCNGMVKELQSWWAQHQGGGGNVADVRVEDAR